MPDFWAKGRTVHQLIVGAVPGDAIADQAVMLRDWLRAAGATSEIFAERIHPQMTKQVRPYRDLGSYDRLIFHYSIGSDLSAFVRGLGDGIVMMYHNITPAAFFDGTDPVVREQTDRGRRELGSFANVVLALSNSEYSRRELAMAGYERTAVLPLAYNARRFALAPSADVLDRYDDDQVNVLFVGRLVPNKRQDEILKAFSYYQRLYPSSRLILPGSAFTDRYRIWLERLARMLGVNAVFPGHVSDEDLVAYYRLADVFVCLSAHEGFGAPLVEAMLNGVPVIAAATSAIPDTLGDAGILLHDLSYPIIAELIHLTTTDTPLRARLIATGRARAEAFAPEKIQARFRDLLAPLLA